MTPEQASDKAPVNTAKNNSPNTIEAVRRPLKPRVKRATTNAQAPLIAANQTKAKETTIDSWQSPTATLLTSATDELFKSVPQLNENATEMKSVLPGRANDKEK